LRNDSAKRNILWCEEPRGGPMTPKFELWRELYTMHLAAKFHHPMFNRSEVIVRQTNPQTHKQIGRR